MVTARRKEREKEQRRNEIIDAAEKLFFAKGFEGVSMDDVAKDTELAKGTLYLYFKNKEALFFAVVQRGSRILNDMFRDGVKSGGNGMEKLYSTGISYYRFYKEYPAYYRLFNYSQSPCFSPGGESADEVLGMGRENVELMRRCIAEGQADGSIRSGIDVQKAAFFLIFSSQGVIDQSDKHKDELESLGISQDEFVGFSLETMGRGLSNERGKWK